MAKGETFSTSGYERKKLPKLSKVAAILGILATTLTTSGCAEPTAETTSSSTTQEQGGPTTDIKTDSNATPTLIGRLLIKAVLIAPIARKGTFGEKKLWQRPVMALH